MAEKLADSDKIFRDSLINNLCDLCDLLPKLNITGDKNLDNMRKEIEQQLCRYMPENLRQILPVSDLSFSNHSQ